MLRKIEFKIQSKDWVLSTVKPYSLSDCMNPWTPHNYFSSCIKLAIIGNSKIGHFQCPIMFIPTVSLWIPHDPRKLLVMVAKSRCNVFVYKRMLWSKNNTTKVCFHFSNPWLSAGGDKIILWIYYSSLGWNLIFARN